MNTNEQIHEFSVVIPALNEEHYIGNCIQSILNDCGEGTEIIVVDNGSTDNTIGIAAELGAKILQTTGSTIARQRNLGAQHARGAVFAFVDADCTVLPGWHTAALQNFVDQRVVAAGAVPEIPRHDTTWVQRSWGIMQRRRVLVPTPTSWLPSANLWIRATAFSKISGFNEALESCEDADIGYRLAKIGKLIHDSAVRIEHHREPRSIRQFFHKEVWHGKNSFDGLATGRITISEIPSLCAPVWLFASLLVTIGGMLRFAFTRDILIFTVGLGAALFLPLAYTIRSTTTKGNIVIFPQLLLLYAVYFVARMIAMIRYTALSKC